MKRLLIIIAFLFGILIIFVVATNMVINIGTKSFIFKNASDVPQTQTALIPGAAILINGALSSVFRDRADTAIELYKAGKVLKILVSGDNSSVEHNEVNPVRKYLLEQGIPDQDIFLDHAGFDTYSSMYRARDVFQVKSMIIATQSFHLPRAVFISRQLGIKSYGMNADAGHVLSRNYLREILADEKALMDLWFQRTPKYLGDVVPIIGDGSKSP